MHQAPTWLVSGTQPSRKLRSSLCISSVVFAAAIAARTRDFSSSVINRPAFTWADAAFGSSALVAVFAAFEETVVDIVEARPVRRPSGVTKRDCAACRSLKYHKRSVSQKSRVSWGVYWEEHTFSLILWKSSTLSEGILKIIHSLYHFFSFTGFPIKERYCNERSSRNGSRSPSSLIELFVKTKDERFGKDRCKPVEMEDIRLFARRMVRKRRRRGKLASETIELSVKSIASCWS